MAKGNNNTIIALALILIVGLFAIYSSTGGDETVVTTTTTDEGAAAATYDIVKDVELTFKDKAGALDNTDGIKVYLTSHNEYADINEAYTAYIDEEIASPYTEGDFSTPETLDADGICTISLSAPVDGIEYYDLIVIDEDAGVTDDYVNTIATIGVLGKETADGTQTLQVISDSETTIDAYKEVKLTLRGDMSILNDEAAATSYTKAFDAGSDVTDQSKTFEAGILTNNAEANDITIYIEQIDDVNNTAEVYVNEITVDGEEYSLVEVTTTNFDSRNPIWKNKPSTTEGSTLYAIDATFDISRGADIDSLAGFDIGLNYDVDLSATGDYDEANIKIVLVSFNGNEDSTQETETFTFKLVESAAASGYDL